MRGGDLGSVEARRKAERYTPPEIRTALSECMAAFYTVLSPTSCTARLLKVQRTNANPTPHAHLRVVLPVDRPQLDRRELRLVPRGRLGRRAVLSSENARSGSENTRKGNENTRKGSDNTRKGSGDTSKDSERRFLAWKACPRARKARLRSGSAVPSGLSPLSCGATRRV